MIAIQLVSKTENLHLQSSYLECICSIMFLIGKYKVFFLFFFIIVFLCHSVVDQSDVKRLNHCNQSPYLLEISMCL